MIERSLVDSPDGIDSGRRRREHWKKKREGQDSSSTTLAERARLPDVIRFSTERVFPVTCNAEMDVYQSRACGDDATSSLEKRITHQSSRIGTLPFPPCRFPWEHNRKELRRDPRRRAP